VRLEGESSWLGRLKSLFHRPRTIVEASPSTYVEEKRFITLHEELMGEQPKVSFAAQMAVYLADPMARAAVDFLAEQVAGPGFYTTAEDPAAKEFIDEFCESVGMDEMLLQTAREIVAFGNCFWSRAPKSVKIIPILSIERIIRTPRGTVKGYVQSKLYGGKTLDPRFVIHFRWNPMNNEAFGSGLLRTVVESLHIGDGEARMSFAEMKARMQKAMIEQFEKFSAPNELWIFKGLSAAELNSFASRLKKLPAKGARLAYNDEADIKQATMQLGRGWEAYVETIINDFLLGLQTPIPRLFTTPGFTEACYSADTLTLTENGWKYYWEIGEEEKIATYNPVTGTVEFHKPEARYVYDYEGPMIHFGSKHADILVTPQHIMHYRTRYWKTQPAYKLLDLRHFRVKVNGRWEAPDARDYFVLEGVTGNGLRASQALSLAVKAEPWLQLIGYYISEGSLHGGIWASLTQKDPEIVKNMRRCLDALHIPYHIYFDKRFNAVQLQLKGGKRLLNALRECGIGAAHKRIPRKYKELPPEQLKILLNALIEGDGRRDKRPNRKVFHYYTISKRLAYDVLEVALRAGYAAFIYKKIDKRPNRRPLYEVAIHPDKTETRIARKRVVHYKGKVYCFTVKNHLFFVMRNGKPTIQGNSARAALEAAERKVMAMQRFIKRIVERQVFAPMLRDAGFDPVEAKVRLNWGQPEIPELNVEDILKAVEIGVINIEEARNILIKSGWELTPHSKEEKI